MERIHHLSRCPTTRRHLFQCLDEFVQSVARDTKACRRRSYNCCFRFADVFWTVATVSITEHAPIPHFSRRRRDAAICSRAIFGLREIYAYEMRFAASTETAAQRIGLLRRRRLPANIISIRRLARRTCCGAAWRKPNVPLP